MKEVVINIKEAIIPFIVVGFLFAMVFQLLPKIGENTANMDTGITYSNYQDRQTFREISERTAPIIQYDASRIWKEGQTVSIPDAFQAIDADGTGIVIRVLDIKNAAGDSLSELPTDGMITFPQAGVYYFKLKAIDRQKKTTEEEIALIVDNS